MLKECHRTASHPKMSCERGCVWMCVYQPAPLHMPVTHMSLEQSLTCVKLSVEMRCEPEQARSPLKCQIIGSTDRSVKTLSLLTLPCGRD